MPHKYKSWPDAVCAFLTLSPRKMFIRICILFAIVLLVAACSSQPQGPLSSIQPPFLGLELGHPVDHDCIKKFCAFGGDCVKCLSSCGDGTCDSQAAEDCSSCASDCGICLNFCGNGACGPGETQQNCSIDCGVSLLRTLGGCTGQCDDGTLAYWKNGAMICADGTVIVCGPRDDCGNCYLNCGTCVATCGDGNVTDCAAGASGKDCSICPSDCGPCEVASSASPPLTCPVP